jgi:DNA polymerase/3'-5' exonuclease PolX
MSEGVKMPLKTAQYIAERFMKRLEPFVSIMCIAGSVRRECSEVGDIEIVCVPKDELSMGLAFPEGFKGMTVNGSRLKRFVYKVGFKVQIELYITTKEDYGRILAIRTGSSAFSHIEIALRWNRLGWCGTEEGLRRKVECNHKSTWKIKPEYKVVPTKPPVFDTEEKFFAFLGIGWIHPKARSWVSKHQEINYSH